MDSVHCKVRQRKGHIEEGMNEQNVPYIVYEGEQARHERTIRRLITIIIICIALIFASNAIWLYAWMQYDYSSEDVTTIQQDGRGVNIIGNENGVSNGAEDR